MSWEPPFSTGTDRAEPTGLRRLLRLPSARLNLTIAVAVLGAVYFLLPRHPAPPDLPPTSFDTAPTSPVPDPAVPIPSPPEAMLGTPATEASPRQPAVSTPSLPTEQDDKAVYTIYLYKLQGLAPDATAGTMLDVWVTWRPPVTKRPKVQLLLEGVQLDRIEPGFEQGAVADLLVDEEEVPDLIYGERFGSFNVVARPS